MNQKDVIKFALEFLSYNLDGEIAEIWLDREVDDLELEKIEKLVCKVRDDFVDGKIEVK